MYLYLDKISCLDSETGKPAIKRLSLYVRSGEIVSVVGPADAGKSTLLEFICERSDGEDGVFIGSNADETNESRPAIIRGWRFSSPHDSFPPQWEMEIWRNVAIMRCAFPNMALDGSNREPPGGWSEEADNVFFSIYSEDGSTVRNIGWKGAAPNDPDLPDLVLVDDLLNDPEFDDPARRRAFIRSGQCVDPATDTDNAWEQPQRVPHQGSAFPTPEDRRREPPTRTTGTIDHVDLHTLLLRS